MSQPSLSLVNQKSLEKKGEKIKVTTVKQSAKVYVYGCFSEKGFGQIHCFTDNLNADKLCKIYKNTS